MSTYHVKSTGSDAADGLTDATAWQTLAKVSGSSFSPGDSILLNGGDTLVGSLILTSSGTDGSPITVGVYGTGNATIHTTTAGNDGIRLKNCGFVDVDGSRIVLTGPGVASDGTYTSTGGGLRVWSDATATGPTFFRHVRADGLTISGYRDPAVLQCTGSTTGPWDFSSGSAPRPRTGNLTSGSAAVTNLVDDTYLSTSGTGGDANPRTGSPPAIAAGMTVFGDGVPAGTTVLSVDSGTQVTLSANATRSLTAERLTFCGNLVSGATANVATGYTGVRFTNLTIADGSSKGIGSYNLQPSWDNTYYFNDVVVSGCTVSNIYGDAALTTTASGDPIKLANCLNGLIADCVAQDCGAHNGYVGDSSGGIFIFIARNTVIRGCKNYRQSQAGQGNSGSGFDLDIDCDNCVLERNYAQACEGPAILLGSTRGATIRNNIGEDCPTVGGAMLHCFSTITDSWIYNNTLHSKTHSGSTASWSFPGGTGNKVYNNIFANYNSGGRVSGGTGDPFGGQTYVDMQGNVYDQGGSGVMYQYWNDLIYNTVSAPDRTYAQWRSTYNFEGYPGADTGLIAPAGVNSLGGGGSGAGAPGTAYDPTSGSNLESSGASWATLGITQPRVDFHGAALSGTKFAGAVQPAAFAVAGPILSAPTATGVGSDRVTLGVTSDTADGDLDYVITEDSGTPTNAQVVFGTDANDAAGVSSGGISPPSVGANSFGVVTGLTPSTAYHVFFAQKTDEDAESNVVGTTFTTDAPPAVPHPAAAPKGGGGQVAHLPSRHLNHVFGG